MGSRGRLTEGWSQARIPGQELREQEVSGKIQAKCEEGVEVDTARLHIP